MSKGEETRELIVERAGRLFNRQGYFGSSLSDIMRETGLEKGGIYGHFKSKEELALAAFDHNFELVLSRFKKGVSGKRGTMEQLRAIVEVFSQMVDDPPVPGGCPVLNTAVESDDAHPALRSRTRRAMDTWLSLLRWTVVEGIEKNELKADLDPDTVVTVLISTYEGAIMLSKLYRDSAYMHRAVKHLAEYIETLKA